MSASPSLIVVEPQDDRREILAERLRCQGYDVDALADPVEAAALALASPPSAVVADLWMPGVSGLQLCRLLGAEPATEHLPIVLRGADDTPRQRFWAARAGAAAYVARGRMGELVRALESAIAAAPRSDGFFQLHPEGADIRERICQQLDAALRESIIRSELRALSTCETFPRLFDMFSQLLCQVASYRWLAVASTEVDHVGVHLHPNTRSRAIREIHQVLGSVGELAPIILEDEDADAQVDGPPPIVRQFYFAGNQVGTVAMAPTADSDEGRSLLDLVAGELGGPLRIVALAAQANELASRDPLTGLLNRRAFAERVKAEISRAERLRIDLSLLVIDLDHFKAINDEHGHSVGDLVLQRAGELLETATREYDHVARWGGEEFVVALPQTPFSGAMAAAERIRRALESLEIIPPLGDPIHLTASFGAAARRGAETLAQLVDRADRAMYEAKSSGRNRVCGDEPLGLVGAL